MSDELWEFGIVHGEVDTVAASDLVEDIESTSTSDAFEFVRAICDGLEFHQDESRHDQSVVKDIGFGEFSEASIDDAAGVENEGFDPFEVSCELDIRDNESKIVFGLKKNADASVAEGDQDSERDVGAVGICPLVREERGESER